MRVAPIGLISGLNIIIADGLAAEAAAITHSHSLGYMPAAVLAHIINRIVYYSPDMSLKEIVLEAKETVKTIFEGDSEINALSKIIDLAVDCTIHREDPHIPFSERSRGIHINDLSILNIGHHTLALDANAKLRP